VSTPSRSELEELLSRCVRYAFSLTHNEEAAHELAQEAVVRVAEHGGPWAVPYLLRTVRNRFIDGRRAAGNRPTQSLESVAADSTTGDAGMREVDARDELGVVLAGLSPAERELLYLAEVEEFTTRQIAEFTGEPRNTILSRLHRIKVRLRERFAGERSTVDAPSPKKEPRDAESAG
jgi:RNA polymerase sigma-70 factor (ECF subfamily)